jgi:hypothetical protein
MTVPVVIYGASDDLIEVEGDVPGCDEYNDEAATFVLTGDGGQVRVGMRYGRSGCWEATIAPLDEGVAGPTATVSISGYTARVEVYDVTSVVREAT